MAKKRKKQQKQQKHIRYSDLPEFRLSPREKLEELRTYFREGDDQSTRSGEFDLTDSLMYRILDIAIDVLQMNEVLESWKDKYYEEVEKRDRDRYG